MHLIFRTALMLCTMLVFVAQALAADVRSYAVLPFKVNGSSGFTYLEKAIPSMLNSRLYWQGHFQPVADAALAKAGAVSDAGSAAKALSATGADYVIWGDVTVMGDNASLDVRVRDKAGKEWRKGAKTRVNDLIASLQGVSDSINAEVFGRGGSGVVAAAPAASAGQANPNFVQKDATQSQVYLNPQFRYQGSDGTRYRSQTLPYASVGMIVADVNGDGKNEIALLSENHLRIYMWDHDGKLKLLGETLISRSNKNFSMKAIDLNRDGSMDIVVATFEDDSNRPYSYFYSFKGNKFTQVAERIPYFVSVVRLPPTFTPTLVGQGWDSLKLFAPGVYTMVKTGGKYTFGARLDLPTGATVFNVAWLPGGRSGKGDQLVMLTDDERLKVFQGNGNTLVHTTMERFSGSSTGMDHYKGMPGLGVDKNYQLPSKYYAPMNLIAADIGHTGEYVMLVNKPISTASQMFDRYRYFPQGEIHALYWDGVGLGLKWKTRRIRGSVAAVDLADATNNGVLDLVVGLNTSPDLGIGSRQCMITAYPLDVSATDPNTPADMSDFEVNPN